MSLSDPYLYMLIQSAHISISQQMTVESQRGGSHQDIMPASEDPERCPISGEMLDAVQSRNVQRVSFWITVYRV